MLTFLDCLRLFSVFQMTALSAFLLFCGRCRIVFTRILTIILLMDMIILSDELVLKYHPYPDFFSQFILNLGVSFIFMRGPLIFLCIQSFFKSEQGKVYKEAAHLSSVPIFEESANQV